MIPDSMFPGRRFLGVICLAVLCGTLTLGLWPFHVPANEVIWLRSQNGLHFGRHGTVLSSGSLTMKNAPDQVSGSIEIWLQPRRIWDSGTFLAFYAPEDPFRLSLRQSQIDLAIWDRSHHARTAALLVADVFRKKRPVFLTITSGRDGTAIYIDGVPAKQASKLKFSTKEFTGQLLVGGSALQSDSWSGELLGLAVYHRELRAPEVREHYENWTRMGRPTTSEEERAVALFLFDERRGNIVHDHANSGVELDIPEKYTVVDQIFLESPSAEFERPGDFWGAVVKNVIGFVPLGWFFYAYFSATRFVKRASLLTVITGTLVSLTIEVLQAYIPTRASGMTDIITNTLGTYVGVALYTIFGPLLAAELPWLPIASARR
jgi:VanZ family protein